MSSSFEKTKNRILLISAIIGIASSFACLILYRDELNIPGYPILPLAYSITRPFCKRIYREEWGIGLIMFEVIAFLRYVIAPLVTCAVPIYDGYVWASSQEYGEAVFYMIIELIACYLVMWLMAQKSRKIVTNDVNDRSTGSFGIIKILIVVFFLYIILTTPIIRDMLFNFSISAQNIDVNYMLMDYRSQIDGTYIVFFYIGLIVLYVELLSLVKNIKILSKEIKIFLIVILSIVYMSCSWSNGQSVSRWSLLISVMVMIYVLLYFYPSKRKIIFFGGIISISLVLIVGSFYKRIAQGMDFSIFEAFQTFMTPKAFNEYLSGVYPVGNGLYAVENIIDDRFTTFLYDTVANVPRLLSTLGVNGTSTASSYGLYYRHIELIIPTVSMSYGVFGILGTPIYSIICVFFMILSQNVMNKSKSLYSRILFFQIMFWCSIVMAVNIQIIQANVWKYVVGLILISIDDRLKIGFNTRKIGAKSK